MNFLKFKATRIILNYDVIHSLSIKEIIELRDRLSAIRKLRKLMLPPVKIIFENHFGTVWMNEGLEHELISSLNVIIIKAKNKSIRRKVAQEGNDQQ